MSHLLLKPVDQVYMQVDCEAGIAMELQEYFTFDVPGAKFMPAFKNRVWDGKIRLYNPLTRMVYAGLAEQVKLFAADRDYVVESALPTPPVFTDQKLRAFIDHINPKYGVRDYQFRAFANAVNHQRRILISPTASGKSFIIYLITRLVNELKKPVLIIVPTTGLVTQMQGDFLDYNRGEPLPIHCIMEGSEKKIAPITIATWQSIYKLKKPFFANFGAIIGDEVHTFKANSLKSIMENAATTQYRIGLTGTLDGTLTNRLVLEGLFGPVEQVTDYATLQEDGHIVKPKVKIILFNYDDAVKKKLHSYTDEDGKKVSRQAEYPQEIDFLITNERRNQAITSLVKSLKGNVLVLFGRVDKHGLPLYDRLKDAMPDRSHHLIHGSVDTEDRERIRQLLETETNAVASCSYQTFGTGINVKNLHHIVYAGPVGKSMIRLLQTIGRGLRTHDSKTSVHIWDLADNLKWRKKNNHSLSHLEGRINIYNENGFEYQIYERKL